MSSRGFRRLFRLAVKSEARVHREIDEELQAHIDARIDYLVNRGMTQDDARAEAIRRFGDFELGRESLHTLATEHYRRRSLLDRIDEIGQDIRFVLRGARRSPAFTIGMVATLAIGLGINASVFRITDQVLLRAPTGVADPRGVRRIESSLQFGKLSSPLSGTAFSYGDTRALVNANVASVSVYSAPLRMPQSEDGRDVAEISVDSVYFRLLGVTPIAGRLFDAQETTPGAGIAVAIVSYDYWQRVLGGAALNSASSIVLDKRGYHVVGVMPRGFSGIDLDPLDVWLPLGVGNMGSGTINGVSIPWYKLEGARPLHAMLRMRAGIAENVASQRLSAALGTKDRDAELPPRTIALRPIIPAGDRARTESTVHLLRRLSVVAIVILFIACANAANLLLARGMRRRQEISVRLALGASRRRVARLLLAESLMLGCVGGLAAAVAGYWTGEALRRVLFPDGRWTTIPLDFRAIGFTALIAIIAGIAAGAAPALQLTAPDLSVAMKDRPGRGRVRTTRTALVVLQTAFTLALLVASGLLIRSLHHLNQVQLGYNPESLVTVGLSRSQYSLSDVAERLKHDASVRGVALATSPPFGTTAVMTMSVPGSDFTPDPHEAPRWNAVGPNYFSVLGARILKGRAFDDKDVFGADPVAIVNSTLAKHYWNGPIPDGGCVLTYLTGCARVVGIVDDMRDAHSSDEPPMRYYLPLAQVSADPGAVIVRTHAGQEPLLLRTISKLIPREAHPEIIVVNDIVKRAMRPWSVATLLFVGLGGVALALACVGMYSVMSYLASERVHEIGVRMVLGASRHDVLKLMLRDGVRLVVAGGLLGLAGAAWGARLLGSLLFGISPFDPTVYLTGFASLVAMAVAASVFPALRAARVDPVTAIRAE